MKSPTRARAVALLPARVLLSILSIGGAAVPARSQGDPVSAHAPIDSEYFEETPFLTWPAERGVAIAVVDMNGDGVADVVTGNYGSISGSLSGVVIHYLDWSLREGWRVALTEGPLKGSAATYDTLVADFDQPRDGHPDLVTVTFGNGVDVLYFNDGVVDAPGRPTTHFGISANRKALPDLPGAASVASYCVKAGDVDGDGILDLVRGDEYAQILYGKGSRAAPFEIPVPICVPVTGANDPATGCGPWRDNRNVYLDDVDHDGDLDLFIVDRTAVGIDPWTSRPIGVRVFRNVPPRGGTTHSSQPFALLQEISMPAPTSLDPPPSCPGAAPLCAPARERLPPGAFSVDVDDLDGDGWEDLAVAVVAGPEAIYLNSAPLTGAPLFGRRKSGDGLPHLIFPSLTPDLCQVLRIPSCGGAMEYFVPGDFLDSTTGALIEDVNGDGRNDLAFTHRSDPIQADPSLFDAAEVYDYVYYNSTTTIGDPTFELYAERLGRRNDGTSYATFHDLDRDGRLEWFDVSCNDGARPWLAPVQGVAIRRR